jgi:hypothetical protein
MGTACSTDLIKRKMHTELQIEILKAKGHLEDTFKDNKILLKMASKK